MSKDGRWAKFMVILTTENHIWVRFGKHFWKFKLGKARPTDKRSA